MTEKMREKYRPFIKKRGGIFTPSTRNRLLRYSPGRHGYSQADADFRYNVRRFVKQALVDLEMFLEVADKKDVNRIINQESLEPIARALLWKMRDKPDASLAMIAHMLIWYGFHYLKVQNPISLPDILDGQIDSAIDISNKLTDCFISSSWEEAAGNLPPIARRVFPDNEVK